MIGTKKNCSLVCFIFSPMPWLLNQISGQSHPLGATKFRFCVEAMDLLKSGWEYLDIRRLEEAGVSLLCFCWCNFVKSDVRCAKNLR